MHCLILCRVHAWEIREDPVQMLGRAGGRGVKQGLGTEEETGYDASSVMAIKVVPQKVIFENDSIILLRFVFVYTYML